MFLVVSRSDVHFGFDRPFFAYPLGGASKIARPKSRVPRKKFVQTWMLLKMIFFANIFVLFRRFFVNFVKIKTLLSSNVFLNIPDGPEYNSDYDDLM